MLKLFLCLVLVSEFTESYLTNKNLAYTKYRRILQSNQNDDNCIVKEVSITVTGQVQGPFYRTSCKNEVIFNRKLVGKLIEKHNGETEIIVQGNESKLESFVRWCKKGPGLSQYVEVKSVDWKDISKPITGFELITIES